MTTQSPPPMRHADTERCPDEAPASAARLRTTSACPDCGGTGTVEGSDPDAKWPNIYGPATCEGCNGCGQVTRCGSCCDSIPANQDYDFCGPCERELEARDSAAEGYQLGRWSR